MFKPTLSAAINRTVPIPDSDATIKIHYIKPGIMQDISQASMQLTSKETEASSGMRSEISFNMTKKDRAIVAECMDGWSGFTNKDGKALKFSQGALSDMIKESTDFVAFVVEAHDDLTEEVESEEEEAAKN